MSKASGSLWSEMCSSESGDVAVFIAPDEGAWMRLIGVTSSVYEVYLEAESMIYCLRIWASDRSLILALYGYIFARLYPPAQLIFD